MRAAFLLVALEVCLVAAAAAQTPPRDVSAVASAKADDIPGQIAALSSPDPIRRALAACYLRSMGRRAEDAVPALLRLLADGTAITPVDCWSDSSSPGLEAARALGSIRSETALAPLLQAVRSDNRDLRRGATRALGLLRDARAVDALLILLRDTEPSIRAEAARALGRMRMRR